MEAGAALVFNTTDGELYDLWFREALPTYGGPLRYRAHLDCDRCRRGRGSSLPSELCQLPCVLVERVVTASRSSRGACQRADRGKKLGKT